MSILALTSDTLIVTPAAGNIEYDGQFFGTDSAGSRAQLQRIVRATAVASTSGTSIDFTGIPAWVERITVMFQNVSSNGSSNFLIQLGDSGGIENTGYLGAGNTAGSATSYTTGFGSPVPNTAASIVQGVLTIQNITGNSWVASGAFSRSDAAAAGVTIGSKTLSDVLTQIRLTTVNGTDTFDAGTVNIIYEG
jgi:hypothetical protein